MTDAPDRTIDTTGKLCPIPIVEAAKAIRTMDVGNVLLVIATDPGVELDMPMWCRATKHEHLGTARDGKIWKSLIRKAGKKP